MAASFHLPSVYSTLTMANGDSTHEPFAHRAADESVAEQLRNPHQPQTENDAELLGYVYKLLIASPFIYAAAGELIASTETRQTAILKLAALFVSIAAIILVLLLRSVVVGSAARRLRFMPDDPAALARWRVGQFATLALSEAVAICGLIFRLAGSSFHYAAPFYLAGLGLLLVVQPRRP